VLSQGQRGSYVHRPHQFAVELLVVPLLEVPLLEVPLLVVPLLVVPLLEVPLLVVPLLVVPLLVVLPPLPHFPELFLLNHLQSVLGHLIDVKNRI